MSHATLTVILPGTLAEDEINDALEAALKPFDENLETPRYVEFTREQLIANERTDFQNYRDKGLYAQFTEDPVKYAEETSNLRHLLYLAGGDVALANNYPELLPRYGTLRAEDERHMEALSSRLRETPKEYTPLKAEDSFPARLHWDDEDFYREATRYYEAEEIGPEGEVYSERNPQSKWDYWVIGGRWAGYWRVLPKGQPLTEMSYVSGDGPMLHMYSEADQQHVATQKGNLVSGARADVLRKYDVDFQDPDLYPATFALLDAEGVWHEKGRMGWFGISTRDKEQEVWNAEYAVLVDAAADNSWFILVDYHI